MNIKAKLDKALLTQTFAQDNTSALLLKYQAIAKVYAEVENAIAVLSDLKNKKSSIYYGAISTSIIKKPSLAAQEISSIWEDEILDNFHPDDLIKKQVLEYHFFYFLKDKPITEWTNYYTAINLRTKSGSGDHKVLHRMFYAIEGDTVRLALCIYNLAGKSLNTLIHDTGVIINSTTGTTHYCNDFKHDMPISSREKEVLLLIDHGKMSKEIATQFNISLNTVNRHRQNILKKLRVTNSMEACRLAKALHII